MPDIGSLPTPSAPPIDMESETQEVFHTKPSAPPISPEEQALFTTLSSKNALSPKKTKSLGRVIYNWTLGPIVRLFSWLLGFGKKRTTAPILRPLSQDKQPFQLGNGKVPSYFNDKLQMQQQMISCRNIAYNFQPIGSHYYEAWVDLDDMTRSTDKARLGENEVQKGSPAPLLFENWMKQNVHILTLSPPRLKTKTLQEQTNQQALEDLFNTFVSSFSLVKKNADKARKQGTIHTGPIGANEFNHHSTIIYVMQRLAADHVGIELCFHEYRDNEDGNRIYETIRNLFESNYEPKDRIIKNLFKIASETCHGMLLNV